MSRLLVAANGTVQAACCRWFSGQQQQKRDKLLHVTNAATLYSQLQQLVFSLLATQTLNTQVEAALQSGLNFKDRFRTNSKKKINLEQFDEQQELAEVSAGLQSAVICATAIRYVDQFAARLWHMQTCHTISVGWQK